MRLDRLITLYLACPLQALLRPRSSAVRRLPILMYHSISDDPEPGVRPYYKTCTSPRRFAEHMRWLAEDGWQGVTLSAGLDWLKSTASDRPSSDPAPLASRQSPRDTKSVVLTFDDGFRDFHTAAFPILRQHGFSATMFLPTGFIGGRRPGFKGQENLRWEEVRQMRGAGIEFGSHTVTHPRLVDLPWAQIESEVRDSKAEIEQRLGCAALSFAYPYAFPSADKPFLTRFLELLQSTGYEMCVTTQVGSARRGDDLLSLKRLPANACDDSVLLRAKLDGHYDWVGVPQAVRKMFHRLPKPRMNRTAVVRKRRPRQPRERETSNHV